MVAVHVPVVGHEEDEGVVQLAALAQGVDDAADLAVEQRAHGIEVTPPLAQALVRDGAVAAQHAPERVRLVGLLALAPMRGGQVGVGVLRVDVGRRVERRVWGVDAGVDEGRVAVAQVVDRGRRDEARLADLGRRVDRPALAARTVLHALARAHHAHGALVAGMVAAQPAHVGVLVAAGLLAQRHEVEAVAAPPRRVEVHLVVRLEVELAYLGGLVSGRAEDVGARRPAVLGQRRAVARHPGATRILARHEADSARHAERVLGVAAVQHDAAGGEAVQVRRVDGGVAVGADAVVAQVVGGDPEDVARTGGGHVRPSKEPVVRTIVCGAPCDWKRRPCE